MTDPASQFELIIALFLAVVGLHYLARRLALPPAAALIVGGGTLAFLPGLPNIAINSELVLVLFLPPLLMDGAWFTAIAPFRRHMTGILSLAVGAVFFTTAAVAFVTKLLLPALPWAACVALGAILSPPDAVSARAVLQHVRLPRRLTTLLEGESLLNDAAGLVPLRRGCGAHRQLQSRCGDGKLRPARVRRCSDRHGDRCALGVAVAPAPRRHADDRGDDAGVLERIYSG
jgi:NhaP-type Na+/H+ or K+/H+ antiporter